MTRHILLRWKAALERRLDGAFPSRSVANPELEVLLERVAQLYPGRAVVAYGSRVTGNADALSDLDVLVIEDHGSRPMVQEKLSAEGVEIDVTCATFNAVLKGLKARGQYNNHWFLSALVKSYRYADRYGDAKYLQEVAERVRSAGPPRLKLKELDAIRLGLLRFLHTAEKLCARSSISPAAAKLAQIRCDQLVVRSIYLFYCVQGRWTTSFHRLVGACAEEFPGLYALWLEYAQCVRPEEALGVAKRIVETVQAGAAIQTAKRNEIAKQFPA